MCVCFCLRFKYCLVKNFFLIFFLVEATKIVRLLPLSEFPFCFVFFNKVYIIVELKLCVCKLFFIYYLSEREREKQYLHKKSIMLKLDAKKPNILANFVYNLRREQARLPCSLYSWISNSKIKIYQKTIASINNRILR